MSILLCTCTSISNTALSWKVIFQIFKFPCLTFVWQWKYIQSQLFEAHCISPLDYFLGEILLRTKKRMLCPFIKWLKIAGDHVWMEWLLLLKTPIMKSMLLLLLRGRCLSYPTVLPLYPWVSSSLLVPDSQMRVWISVPPWYLHEFCISEKFERGMLNRGACTFLLVFMVMIILCHGCSPTHLLQVLL